MHPGPINRGVEIDSEIADGVQSVILAQVTNGLAVRMAVLYLCAGVAPTNENRTSNPPLSRSRLLVVHPFVALAEDPLPKGWRADLDSVAELIGSELEQSTAQQEMNRLSGRLAEVREAELVIVYLQLYAASSPVERAKLKTEQTLWLKKRGRTVEETTPNDSVRGTIAPLEEK